MDIKVLLIINNININHIFTFDKNYNDINYKKEENFEDNENNNNDIFKKIENNINFIKKII